MPAILRAALLTICISLYAGAQNRSLALYAGEADGLDASAVRSAQEELQRLLAPTRIDMVWKDLASRNATEQFDRVVVISFDGVCSDTGHPNSLSLPDSQVSLADSSVSDGAVLPFFRVDCRYLAQMLTPSLRSLSSEQRSSTFGRALARIMAHEIYHIIGETTAHQARGVAKASFSVQDLIGEGFDFDSGSLAQMRPSPPLLALSLKAPAANSVSESEEPLAR